MIIYTVDDYSNPHEIETYRVMTSLVGFDLSIRYLLFRACKNRGDHRLKRLRTCVSMCPDLDRGCEWGSPKDDFINTDYLLNLDHIVDEPYILTIY